MLLPFKSIFFVGIKGVAMANLAHIFKQMGKTVSGSDIRDTFITDESLKNANISIVYSFDPKKVPKDVDLVVYSAAHGGKHNHQVMEAFSRGTTVLHQAELIGRLLTEFKTSLAVAGCHGKTTTSALLTYALKKLNQKPSYMIGVSEFNKINGGAYNGSEYFVVEADEYGVNPPEDKTPKFNFLRPTHSIVTNIDFDHPDVFADLEETKKTFLKYMKTIINHNPESRIFACIDNKPLHEALNNIQSEKVITYGMNPHAKVRVISIYTHLDKTEFEIEYETKKYSFEIQLFGEKNVVNATGVISLLLYLGFKPKQIKEALALFTGAKRRFELKKKVKETYLFDDYGHHPEEIEATIQAAKMRFPGKRIVVIFQPHTFSRTERMKEEFVHALSKADRSLLLPVFGSAREEKADNATDSDELSRLAKQKGIHFIHSFSSSKELLDELKDVIKPGDVIFTMGAGDVYKLEEKIISILKTL